MIGLATGKLLVKLEHILVIFLRNRDLSSGSLHFPILSFLWYISLAYLWLEPGWQPQFRMPWRKVFPLWLFTLSCDKPTRLAQFLWPFTFLFESLLQTLHDGFVWKLYLFVPCRYFGVEVRWRILGSLYQYVTSELVNCRTLSVIIVWGPWSGVVGSRLTPSNSTKSTRFGRVSFGKPTNSSKKYGGLEIHPSNALKSSCMLVKYTGSSRGTLRMEILNLPWLDDRRFRQRSLILEE